MSGQLDLFGRPAAPWPRERVEPAQVAPELAHLARGLPAGLRLGTSSWSFPGWAGSVYARTWPRERLARDGLAAYAQHPLLRCVGLDRSFYAPLPAETLAGYAAVVGPDFRFVVKAWEGLVLARFPHHPRYGAQAGQANPSFLDAECARRDVIEPLVSGLGERLGALVFQLPPQDPETVPDFGERLGRFLTALPKGPLYAVEIRNRTWLDAAFADALASARACPCLTVHPRMPSLERQARVARADRAPALLIRWMLGGRQSYEAARARYAPFDRLAAPDPQTRACIAALCTDAARADQPAYVSVNNKAEGSAPLSVIELAGALATR